MGHEKYVCTLSPELQQQARDELHETPEKREQAIVLIRDWIKAQPHMHVPTDDWTILRFLRGCKFSIEKTKKKMELHYTLKSALPEWFTNRDPTLPEHLDILKRGMFLPLTQKDQKGRQLLLSRMADIQPSSMDPNLMMKVSLMILDVLEEEDEIGWITGTVNVADLKDYTAGHMLLYTPPLTKKMMVLWQDGYPMRPKGIHYFNTSPVFTKFFGMFKQFMNEKMKKRVHFHGTDLESLHKEVSPDILPAELGGTNGTYESLAQEVLERTVARRDWLMKEEKYGVDESKRPGKPKTSTDLFGLEGSFTKLNVD